MFVEHRIIDAAATLIAASLGDLPVKDDAEWRGFDAGDTALLEALIDELTSTDLCVALRAAAARLAVTT